MPETGTLIDGKYRILSKLREGGMGAIYKVHHSLLNEVRVIKVMRSQGADNPDLQRRFAQEAQLITRVRHQNICLIFDYAVDEDLTAYIVMEYIEGVSLADWLKLSGPLEVPLALEITHQALEALEYLHRKRVIHRDISPENIMLTTDYEGGLLVKLIDLGIAKALDADDGVTKTGVFIGKFKYSSPEQLMSDGQPLDGRSDLYSLAVVLYQMLTGQLPLRGETAHQLAAAHLFQPPIPFDQTEAGAQIPEDVKTTVLRALEKKRDDRFPDATDLRRTIEAIQARLPRPDLVEAAAFMELVRSTSGSALPDHPTPTPSAQERLNRRFQPSETPVPMASTVDAFSEGGEDATEITDHQSDPETDLETEMYPVAIPQPASSRRRFLIGGAALLIAAAITAAIIVGRPSPEPPMQSEAETTRLTTLTADTASVATLVTADTALSATDPTTATLSTAGEPPVTTTSESTPRTAAGRNVAVQSRTRMIAAKNAARSAGATQLAGVIFSRAEQTERQAENEFRSGRMESASGSFLTALGLYQDAGTAAQQETARRIAQRESEARALAAEAEKRRLEQEQRQRQAELEKNKRVDPPPATPEAAPSEEPRIRSAIQRYINASESLDANAYLAIFPSAERRRVESGFASLRSQTLSLDIRSIEIARDGQSATVRATESRVATPRAGSEQRVGGERTITLARQGANWVITTIR